MTEGAEEIESTSGRHQFIQEEGSDRVGLRRSGCRKRPGLASNKSLDNKAAFGREGCSEQGANSTSVDRR